MVDILIGADPELFVKKNGSFVSAYGLIPGTKEEPHKVKNGAVQVDGMALEFNISPASNGKEFRDNINSVMGQMRAMVGEEYEFALEPTAEFGKEYIDSQPNEAKVLGCEPDYNAYTGETNPRPDAEQPFRTASGHIHVGWTTGMDPHDPEHFEACIMLTKQMDALIAPVSRLWDTDNKRRTLYGALGSFRPKPYGMEYRVLSNRWLAQRDTINFVYEATERATKRLLQGKQYYKGKNTQAVFDNDDPQAWWNTYNNNPQNQHDFMYSLLQERLKEWDATAEARMAEKARKKPSTDQVAEDFIRMQRAMDRAVNPAVFAPIPAGPVDWFGADLNVGGLRIRRPGR